EEWLDDRCAGVEVRAGESAGVDHDDPAADELDDRRIALPHVEESGSSPACHPRARPPGSVEREAEQADGSHPSSGSGAAIPRAGNRAVEQAELAEIW